MGSFYQEKFFCIGIFIPPFISKLGCVQFTRIFIHVNFKVKRYQTKNSLFKININVLIF
jgi:hypothetical protein